MRVKSILSSNTARKQYFLKCWTTPVTTAVDRRVRSENAHMSFLEATKPCPLCAVNLLYLISKKAEMTKIFALEGWKGTPYIINIWIWNNWEWSLEDQRHVNHRYLKRECHTENFCMLNPLSLPLTLLVNMKGRLRSISHHVLPSDFLEEYSMLRSDWALKKQTLFLFVCIGHRKRERERGRRRERESVFEGPSPNLEPISMQMLRPDLEGPTIVRRGEARLA